MKFKTLSLNSNSFGAVSNFFFLLLYPGFVIYNLAVGYSIIPAIFGGFFGLFSALHLLVMVLFFSYLYKLKLSPNEMSYVVLIIFYVLITTLISLIGYVSFGELVRPALNQHFTTIFLLVSSILIGFGLNINSSNFKLINFLFVIFVFLFFAYYVASTGRSMFYMRAITEADSEGLSTYQGYARTILISGFCLLSVVKGSWSKVFVFLVVLFVLFIAGSRSEFVAFFVSFSFFSFVLIRKRNYLLPFVFFVLLLGTSFFVFWEKIQSVFGSSRIFQLGNIEQASSWQSRGELMSIAVTQISESPLFGQFGGHVINAGGTGSYAHNIISSWANYGLLPFVLYIILVIIPFIYSLNNFFIKRKLSQENKFLFMVSSSVVFLLLFSKSIFWFVPGLLFGFYLKIRVLNVRN